MLFIRGKSKRQTSKGQTNSSPKKQSSDLQKQAQAGWIRLNIGPPINMAEKTRNLEERSAEFAEAVRQFVPKLPRTVANIEDVKQLVRASGSVPANCIEANEALGNKDRVMRFRISRKEAKECQLWLRLVNTGDNPDLMAKRELLRQEAHELKLIFTSIIKKLE